jgi:GNAT superfamily N-acetyltransferase
VAGQLVIREAMAGDADDIARVHVDTWQTAYDGILPPDVIASHSYEQRQQYWRTALKQPDHELVFVAEQDGRVVGFASGGPERSGDPQFPGELYALYILAKYQNRGAGQALVRAIARRLASDGMTSMLVWVLADNPARSFYVYLGAIELRQQPIQMGTTTVEEVAYGWKDLRALITPHPGPAKPC